MIPRHPLGRRVRELVLRADPTTVIGSVMLRPEVLVKPARAGRAIESRELEELLTRLDLHPVTRRTSDLALTLAVHYGLKSIDATHLSTAVLAGADRFITNNRRDFGKDIDEIDVVYPDEL